MAIFPNWIFLFWIHSTNPRTFYHCALELLSVTTGHHDPEIGAGTRTGTRTRGIGESQGIGFRQGLEVPGSHNLTHTDTLDLSVLSLPSKPPG